MWWIPLATAAVSAYMGNQQQKEQERARKDQALINMYSPLFGKSPEALGMRHNYTATGAISGALGGYQLASQLKDYLKSEEADVPDSTAFIPYASTPAAAPAAPAPAAAPSFSPYFNATNPWRP